MAHSNAMPRLRLVDGGEHGSSPVAADELVLALVRGELADICEELRRVVDRVSDLNRWAAPDEAA